MLYSPHNLSIQKPKKRGFDSNWQTSRIFTGDYWDDFGLVSASNSDKPNILVLGAGKGACIRPILASNACGHVTLVDNDSEALVETSKVFKIFFPKVQSLEFIHRSGEDFVKECGSKFDLIWVDLFTDRGYAPCMGKRCFYQDLVKVLHPLGTLAINCFTVPTPFALNKLAAAESFVTNQLKSSFREITYLPFRRNITLVARAEKLEKSPGTFLNLRSLKPRDRLVYKMQRMRMQNPITFQHQSNATYLPDFDQIDSEFRMLWKESKIIDNAILHQTLNQCELTQESLSILAERDSDSMAFLSVVIGGINRKSIDQVFLRWACELLKNKNTVSPVEIHFFLTQLVAIAVRQESMQNLTTPNMVKFIENQLNQMEVV